MKPQPTFAGRRLLIGVWLLAASAACVPAATETALPPATRAPTPQPPSGGGESPPTVLLTSTPAPAATETALLPATLPPATSPSPTATLSPALASPSATPRRFPALRFTVPLGSRSQGMVGELLVTEETFLQLKVRDERVGTFDGAGIERVTFEVFGPDNFYYLREERTAPYCVFDGSGRCDPWRLEGGRLFWPDGAPLVADVYSVQVIAVAVTPDASGDRDGNWNFDVTIELP